MNIYLQLIFQMTWKFIIMLNIVQIAGLKIFSCRPSRKWTFMTYSKCIHLVQSRQFTQKQKHFTGIYWQVVEPASINNNPPTHDAQRLSASSFSYIFALFSETRWWLYVCRKTQQNSTAGQPCQNVTTTNPGGCGQKISRKEDTNNTRRVLCM